MGRQIHVIRTRLELIHEQIEEHKGEIEKTQSDLVQLMRRVKELASHIPEQQYTSVLRQNLRILERAVDHYIHSADKMLDVLHVARKGQLHPSLLTAEQLEPIFRDVLDHVPDLSFPVPGPDVSLEELAQVTTTTVVYEGRILKVILDILLIEKIKYSLYKTILFLCSRKIY